MKVSNEKGIEVDREMWKTRRTSDTSLYQVHMSTALVWRIPPVVLVMIVRHK